MSKAEYRKCNANKYGLRKCKPSEMNKDRGCTRAHQLEAMFIL